MNVQRRWLRIGLFATFTASCLFATSRARAAFPTREDTTPAGSIGSAVIVINPVFQAGLAAAAYPGYDPVSCNSSILPRAWIP
jgi:hypothetical protein